MTKQFDKKTIETLVKEILLEHLGHVPEETKKVDPSGIISLALPLINVTEVDRLNTGNGAHKVYCHDLLNLRESPRLGAGLMVMEATTFDWQLDYDEIDYIIEGVLTINIADRKILAKAGEVILIPKGSKIQFSATERVRFLYVTYPADWQGSK